MSEWQFSTKKVADFFQISTKTLRKWGHQGCPKLGPNQWNLKAVFDWWKSNKTLLIQPFNGKMEPFDISELKSFDFE